MKKNLWLGIALLITSFSSLLKADIYTTLKHPKNNQTLTLIAEVGVGDETTKKTSQDLAKKIKNASEILLEIEQGNIAVQEKINKIILKGYPEQLKEQVTSSTWKKINEWLKNKKQEPGSHLITSVPSHWSLILIGNIVLRDKAEHTITHYLSTLDNKRTAIFNAEEQQSWFMDFDKKAIDSLLNHAITEDKKFHKQVINSWKNNDVKTLKDITKRITLSGNGNLIQKNYDSLNEKITERLQRLEPGKYIVALNIVSYIGENNVIERLIKEGYQPQKTIKTQQKGT